MEQQPGTIRDFDQLREEDVSSPSRVATVAFVVLGGAAVVFAGLALSGRASRPGTPKPDPLGDLVAEHGRPSATHARPAELHAADVTFPSILSDDAKTTTALAVVRTGALPAAPATPAAAPLAPVAAVTTTPAVALTAPATPPPAGDRLPVVPLVAVPAQNVMEATRMMKQPRDPLTREAMNAAPDTASTPPSAAGHEGGYQLQVSSFRSQAEAQAFADQLRNRGHKAHVTEVNIPSRGGNWYRVRIGPFTNQHAAANYRTSFETHEHVVSFIVPPSPTAH